MHHFYCRSLCCRAAVCMSLKKKTERRSMPSSVCVCKQSAACTSIQIAWERKHIIDCVLRMHILWFCRSNAITYTSPADPSTQMYNPFIATIFPYASAGKTFILISLGDILTQNRIRRGTINFLTSFLVSYSPASVIALHAHELRVDITQ